MGSARKSRASDGDLLPRPGRRSGQPALPRAQAGSQRVQRAELRFPRHRESGGQFTTFGDLERLDVLAAVNWLRRRTPLNPPAFSAWARAPGPRRCSAAAADPGPRRPGHQRRGRLQPLWRFVGNNTNAMQGTCGAGLGFLAVRMALPLAGWQLGATWPRFAPMRRPSRSGPGRCWRSPAPGTRRGRFRAEPKGVRPRPAAEVGGLAFSANWSGKSKTIQPAGGSRRRAGRSDFLRSSQNHSLTVHIARILQRFWGDSRFTSGPNFPSSRGRALISKKILFLRLELGWRTRRIPLLPDPDLTVVRSAASSGSPECRAFLGIGTRAVAPRRIHYPYQGESACFQAQTSNTVCAPTTEALEDRQRHERRRQYIAWISGCDPGDTERAESAGSGGTVNLAAGSYNISSQLTIPSGVTLQGNGKATLNWTGAAWGTCSIPPGTASAPR